MYLVVMSSLLRHCVATVPGNGTPSGTRTLDTLIKSQVL